MLGEGGLVRLELSFVMRNWLVLVLGRFFAAGLVLISSGIGVQAQTLETIRERGFLICASSNALPGFSQQSETGLWSGFDVDFCRAVAAAVFGNPDLVEFRSLEGEGSVADLQTGSVDLLARGAIWSLHRDTAQAIEYVATSFFDGQAFMVPEDSGVVSAFELDAVSICVIDNSDELTSLREFFFRTQTNYTEVVYEERQDLAVAYAAGLCDTISAPSRWLHALRIGLPEPSRSRILPERISKEPLGPIVRNGDAIWADIVRWTYFALINAEELGINSANLDTMLEVKFLPILRFLGAEPSFSFGQPLGLEDDWMLKVIRAVGNYGEMYDRNFGPQTGPALPRGLNSLFGQGGLLYAPAAI